MGRLVDLAFLVFSFQAAGVFAQGNLVSLVTFNPTHGETRRDTANCPRQRPAPQDGPDDIPTYEMSLPGAAVTVEASFPDAEIFGIKITNGKPYESVLTFMSEEPEPVTIQFIGGSLWTLDDSDSRIVRNLTTNRYGVELAPGEKQSLPYRFQTNLHPQDLRLNLAAVVIIQGIFHNLQAFNGTVSVVEPDASIFDPQL